MNESNVSVLLITFNRPKFVKQMLSVLKQAEIKNLFVFRDGPRPNNEEDKRKCQEIETLCSQIDWPCNLQTNFMQNNLGCGYGPFSAISWAFQYTEELIILEDDCIPSLPFFNFCSYLLEKYKDEEKVRLISGRSQMSEHPSLRNTDYLFTQYAPTWGWATWKRVWNNFDMQQRELADFFRDGGFTTQFSSKEEARFFNLRYKKGKNRVRDVFHTWDGQFGLHSRMNGALGIIPSKNLIKYIGIEGTHPVVEGCDNHILDSETNYSILSEPSNIVFDQQYERAWFEQYLKPKGLKNRIKYMFGFL